MSHSRDGHVSIEIDTMPWQRVTAAVLEVRVTGGSLRTEVLISSGLPTGHHNIEVFARLPQCSGHDAVGSCSGVQRSSLRRKR